jgi:hypothetical protein
MVSRPAEMAVLEISRATRPSHADIRFPRVASDGPAAPGIVWNSCTVLIHDRQ